MPEKLQIEIIDGPGIGKQVSEGEQSAQTIPDRTPRPRDREPVTGPKKSSQDTLTAFDTAAVKLGDVLGVGGLTKTAIELRRAFTELYESVNAAKLPRPDVNGGRVVETKSPKQSKEWAGDNQGPPARRPSRERPAEAITGPPQQVTQELVPSGPPAKTEVTGPPKAPPIVGPKAAADVAVDAELVGPTAGGIEALAAAAGPAAVAVATLTAAAVAGGAAMKRIAEGLDAEAHRLSKFSPALAGATATNDIRLLFADMRRANQIGPQLARFENRFGRGQEALMDLQTQMLKVLLEIEEELAPLIEAAIATAKTTADYVPVISKVLLESAKASDPKIRIIVDAITIIAKIAKRWAPREPDAPPVDPFMQAFLSHFDGRDPIAAVRAAAGRAVP